MNILKWFKNDDLIITNITYVHPIKELVATKEKKEYTPIARTHFKSWREVRSEVEPTLAHKQRKILSDYFKKLKNREEK
jgi:hypothetical protein